MLPRKGKRFGRERGGKVLRGPGSQASATCFQGVRNEISQSQDSQGKQGPLNLESQLNSEILMVLDLAMEGTSWGQCCEPPTLCKQRQLQEPLRARCLIRWPTLMLHEVLCTGRDSCSPDKQPASHLMHHFNMVNDGILKIPPLITAESLKPCGKILERLFMSLHTNTTRPDQLL